VDYAAYSALFISSFLASSLLPIASEGVLGAMLYKGYAMWACIWVATMGNWLGGVTSYIVGWLGKREWLSRYFGVKEQKVKDVQKWIDKYGIAVALFCWVPVIGDPLVVALGFMRSRPIAVFILMLIGRLLRYIAIAYTTLNVI
jgi:membrane protein YqaA with SNARE-associated domain